uniref:Uncharacterized protein n=2 Tax=Oryza TaxID=4527 RepID=Q6YTH8_ORYSJ|nr:hypothetical protein [Oryza sativa Japonica Group]
MAVGDDGLVVDGRMSGQRGGSVATKVVGSIAGGKPMLTARAKQNGLSDDMRKSDFHTWLFYPYAKI